MTRVLPEPWRFGDYLLVQGDGDFVEESSAAIWPVTGWLLRLRTGSRPPELRVLVMTAGLGAIALLYSMLRWSRIGVHFIVVQFLLMGLETGPFCPRSVQSVRVYRWSLLAASYGAACVQR